ncbi:T9SS type A sorting domain-containing protein, partial [Ignavibacterium album]
NDTIKSNTTLFDDMTIKDNVKLIIDRGKYYTIRDTVTLKGTGFITGAGYLNTEQNGTINITYWNQSVFKGRQVNNPKIIWGRYPTSGTVTKYRIFRAKGNNQFIQIAEVDSTKRQYIDSTTIIYDRPEANLTYADYYVRAVYQPSGNAPLSTSTNSNIIRYDMVDGIAPDKLAMSNTEIITEYKLEQNYPNPFNPTTVISWQSPKGSHQTLKVYDILGNEVATLVDEYKESGRYKVEFDASKLASGVYIYRFSAGNYVDVKKMIVVK